MIATVPHVTSGSGLRKFQADGSLFDRVYISRNIEARTLYHCCLAEGRSIKLRIVNLCLYPQFSGLQITFFCSSFTLVFVSCLVLLHFSTLSHKHQDFWNDVVQHKM